MLVHATLLFLLLDIAWATRLPFSATALALAAPVGCDVFGPGGAISYDLQQAGAASSVILEVDFRLAVSPVAALPSSNVIAMHLSKVLLKDGPRFVCLVRL
jgi:hypothetical protein